MLATQLWTDAKSREFVAAEYPWFLDTFDGYSFPIQRADAIRYFVLAHYGGVYIDLDDVSTASPYSTRISSLPYPTRSQHTDPLVRRVAIAASTLSSPIPPGCAAPPLPA